MAGEVPCMSYVALYVISMHIVNSNSRSSSNHWKLNVSAGKVEQADASVNDNDQPPQKNGTNNASKQQNATSSDDKNNDFRDNSEISGKTSLSETTLEDRMMGILTNKVEKGGEWIVTSESLDDNEYFGLNKEYVLDELSRADSQHTSSSSSSGDGLVHSKCTGKGCSQNGSEKNKSNKRKKKLLDCGKKVNSTMYDHLRGVSERGSHSHIPEPDVAMVFKSTSTTAEVDMRELEVKLRQAKVNLEKSGDTQKPHAAQVYNLIGNFWRIKGNTPSAIECFRKALYISPEDPDILLNLARVLFNLQYLDDAIFLARRSLHLQPDGENSWLQHYTLGEILKAYGHTQEAAAHFYQTLDLHPTFAPAKSQLRELAAGSPDGLGGVGGQPSVTHFTLFIILFLVVAVLFGVVTSIETGFQDSSSSSSSGLEGSSGKFQPRHFNRAMAMRSIKLGINPRLCRLRRAANS